MAGWTIHKFVSIVIFVVLMAAFFFWIISQVSDLGLFFGLRTSHTVVNDIASLMTTVGGIPGEPSVKFEAGPAKEGTQSSQTLQGAAQQPVQALQEAGQRHFQYRVYLASRVICVISFIEDAAKSTTDCASHPYDFDEPQLFKTDPSGNLCIDITKTAEGKMELKGC